MPLAIDGQVSHVLTAYRSINPGDPFLPDVEPTSVR